MELLIKAETAEELRYKITSLANQYETKPMGRTNQAPKLTKPEVQETETVDAGGSIFDSPPSVAPKKGKKAAAPVVEPEPEETTEDEAPAEEGEDLAEALRTVIAKCGGNAAREMMGKLGYTHIGKIPNDEKAKFLKACQETIKAKSKPKK